MDNVKLLEQVVSEAQRVVDGVKPPQLGDPTPCEEFDVRQLLNHLTVATTLITNGVHQQPIDTALLSQDLLGGDPAGSFRERSKQLVEAWNEPGVLDGTVLMPFGETPADVGLSFSILEMYTHVCDAAVATNQEDALDSTVAANVEGIARQMPIDNFRIPGVFGAEVPCDEAEPAHRRLLSYLGRKV